MKLSKLNLSLFFILSTLIITIFVFVSMYTISINVEPIFDDFLNYRHNKPEKITKFKLIDDPDNIEVLINKTHFIKDNYVPNDLISVGGNYKIRQEAAIAFNNMKNDINQDNIYVNVVSAYRSHQTQIYLYNNYMRNDPLNAPYYSAYPGTSEHELGLALDLSFNYSLYDDLDEYPLGIWLLNNSYKYGFILRYPEDKTDITGYVYEPWHYRYVGVELAKFLFEHDLCLEEYYELEEKKLELYLNIN